ncbi:bacteriocin immunity protein [Pseudomonas violetae]|uniref:Bacteriocin immunity protein n=1 Tax=Pseudomonas violetae TaxID=2915813 RepID=A0ABT0F3N3_9PSED|nr:bacteriocin immunity protein [Pseudomonas violetae]MCK1792326.1 bacteriocin immunity protein [Pseudomonas violetae]
MTFKERFEDYTEAEFLEFLRCLFEDKRDLSDDGFDDFIIKGILHFEAIAEHPDGIHAFSLPGESAKSSPEKVLKRLKEWRAANNKPGFKLE